MRSPVRSLLALSALLATLGIAACDADVSIGDRVIESSQLELESLRSLTAESGQKPASIECPEDLKAEVGESEICILEDRQGGTHDMTVTVTSVDDDGNARFDIVLEAPKTPDTAH